MSQLTQSFYKNVQTLSITNNETELIKYLSHDGLNLLKQIAQTNNHTTLNPILYRDFGLILINLISICYEHITDEDAEIALQNLPLITSIFNSERTTPTSSKTSNIFETLDYMFDTIVYLFHFHSNTDANTVNISLIELHKTHIEIAKTFHDLALPLLTTQTKILWFYQKKIRSLLAIFQQIIRLQPLAYANNFSINPFGSILTTIYNYLQTNSTCQYLSQLTFDILHGFALLIEQTLSYLSQTTSIQRRTTNDLLTLINQLLISDYFSLFHLFNTDRMNESNSKCLLECCSLILKNLKIFRSEEVQRKQNRRFIRTYTENSYEQACMLHRHQNLFEITITNKMNFDGNIMIKNDQEDNQQIKRTCTISGIYDKLLRLIIKQFECSQPSFDFIQNCLGYLILYGSCSCYSLSHYRTLLSKINSLKTNENILLALEQQSIELLRQAFLLIFNCSQRSHHHHHHLLDNQTADSSLFWSYLSNNLFQRSSRYSLNLARSFPDLIQCCSITDKQYALKFCINTSLEYYRSNVATQNSTNIQMIECLIRTLPNLLFDIVLDTPSTSLADTLITLSSLFPSLLIHALPVLGCLLTSTSDCLNLTISESFLQLIIKLTNSWSLSNDGTDNLCNILIILLQKCPTFRQAFYAHLCHLHLYEHFQLMLNNKSPRQSSIIASILVSISYYTKSNDNRFNYKLILEQITLYSEKNRYDQSWFELLVRLSLSQQYQDKRTRWKSSTINKTNSSNECGEDTSSASSCSPVTNYEVENFDDINDEDAYHADVESLSDETPVETISKQNQTCYPMLILFPELVILGLEIVWQNVDNEWSDQQNTMKTSIYITNLVTYLELLSILVRANSYNCVVLKKLNIDGYLFTCLTQIVPRTSFIQKDTLISLIITLLQFLWSQSLTVNQLDQCFKLILTHPSLVGPLLRLFKHLVHQIDSNQPRSYCSMPLSSIVTSKAGSSLHLTLDQLLSLKYPQIESEINSNTNIRHTAIVTETLKNVQFHFPLTLAIWLRVNYPFDKRETNENLVEDSEDLNRKDEGLLLHILTLQHEGIQLQLWLDSKTYLCLKIIQFTSSTNPQLIDFNIRLYNLSRASWSHIFFTISKTSNTVRVCLNGQTSSAKIHPLPPLYSSNSTKPWCISLGQQSLDSCTSFYYDLGSILLFDKVDLFNGINNDYIPTYLYSLGSDHWHFLTGGTQQQSIVNNWIYQRFTRVHPTISIDQFEGEQNSCLLTLKRSLIASYTSNNPWTLFLFNINSEPIEEVPSSRLNKILPFRSLSSSSSSSSTATASTSSTGTSSITSMDENVLSTTTTISLPSRISLEQSSNILNICEQLGGILNFIYLFAKIIEINPFQSSSCICHISDIIFSSIWKIKSYYSLFNSLDGYRLIVKILTTNECTRHITDEFYEVLIDKSIVLNQQRLYDINLFHFILLDWKIWYNHSKKYFLILKILNDLLSDQNNLKYYHVNRQLFKTHFTLEHFLIICQELIDEQKILINEDLTKLLVNIIETLVENDINIIALLMNFVLLIHPLVRTYVTYNKEHFYFIAKSFDYYQKLGKFQPIVQTKKLDRKRSSTMISEDGLLESSSLTNSSVRKSHSFSDLLSSSISINNNESDVRRLHTNTVSTSLTPSKTFHGDSHTLGNQDTPHNIDYLSTGILKLLANLALTTSDRLMMKLIDHVFRLNILIVLLLDPSIAKRVQTIKLLDNILKRMEKEKVQKEVLSTDLHTMLANQIYHQLNGHKDEKELLEICVSIALQRPIEFDIKLKLSEQIHDHQQYFSIIYLSPPCPRSQVGFALILSFIEKFSLTNIHLCQLILDLLDEIIRRSNDENRHFLVDIGLTQVLFNTLSSAICSSEETIILAVQKCLNSLIMMMFVTTINDGEISFLSIFDNLIGMMMMINYGNLDQDASKYTQKIFHQTLSNMFNSIIDSIDKPSSTLEAPTVSRSSIDDQNMNSHLIENHDRFRKFLHLALDYIYAFHHECQYFEAFTLRLLDICLLGSAYLMEKRTNHPTSRNQMSLIIYRCGDSIKQIGLKLLTIALEPIKQRFFFRIQVLKHIVDQPNAKGILEYLLLNDNQCYVYHQILIYLQILSKTTPNDSECEQISVQSSSEHSRKSIDSGHSTTIKPNHSISNGEESSSNTVNISTRTHSRQTKTLTKNTITDFQAKESSTTTDEDEQQQQQQQESIETRRLSNTSMNIDEQDNRSQKISDRSYSPSLSISSLSSELTSLQQTSMMNYQSTIHSFRDLMRSVTIQSLATNDSQANQRRKLTNYLLTPATSSSIQSFRVNSQCESRHSFDWPKADSTPDVFPPVKPSTFRRRRSHAPNSSSSPISTSWSDIAEQKLQEYTTTIGQLIEATQKRLISTYRISLQTFTNGTVSTITSRAMDITQDVINYQGHERKKFLEHLRTSQSLDLRTKHLWHQLIAQLTHEYGVWFESASYPKFWELDPTENPQRERRRLQRTYCLMEKRFFQPQIPNEVLVSPPLSYLFGTRHYQSLNIQTVLHRNERIEYQCRCTNVTPNNEIKGELLVGTTRIYFVADEQIASLNNSKNASTAMTSFAYNYHSFNDDSNSFSIAIDDICEMYKRRYLLTDLAVELFFINGITLMFAHVSSHERDNLYRLLEKRNILLGKQERVNEMQSLWKQGYMTNFEYLMQLNKLAGRTFLDLMQYPVYPYIVANYDSAILDLRLQGNYRNLAKPIAIQHPEKEEKFVDNYHALEDARAIELARQQDNDQQQMASIFGHQSDPYHFASLYSNSGIVLHYLVRLLPYTRMFLDYQDNNFDCADRTFHDVKTSYWLSSFESTSDFKELIPEFYYLHDFLLNKQGFNFGKRQNGEQVSDVTVTPWSKRNARLFVCGLRQALESDHVTTRLHQWIDLIFGYKQTGKAALDAINVYHAACYYGFPIENIEDPVTQKAYYGIIRTYGQVPKQLFSQPHPQAVIASSSYTSSLTTANDKRQNERAIFETKLPENSIHRQIINVHWGDFVGSYDMPSPDYISGHDCSIPVTSFVVRNSGTCIICLPSSSLVIYNEYILNESTGEQVNVAPSNSTSPQLDTTIALKWNTPDGIVRCRQLKQSKIWYNFLIPIDDQDKITCCTSIDYRLLFMGKKSGLIEIYRIKQSKTNPAGIELIERYLPFIAHRSAITCLHINRQFSLLISASSDGMLTLWDTNRLSYVRTYKQDNQTIYHLTSSDITGDIAYLSSTGNQWHLSYLTCNCDLIGCLTFSEQLNCLCFTSAPEGAAVNALLGGFEDGKILMWSTWDLTLLRQLDFPQLRVSPITAICVSKVDRRRLYVADRDRRLHLIESRVPSSTSPSQPPYILFVN